MTTQSRLKYIMFKDDPADQSDSFNLDKVHHSMNSHTHPTTSRLVDASIKAQTTNKLG